MKKTLLVLLLFMLQMSCTRVYLQRSDGAWVEQGAQEAGAPAPASEMVINVSGDRLVVEHNGAVPSRTEVRRDSNTTQRFYVHDGWVTVQTNPGNGGQMIVRPQVRRMNNAPRPDGPPADEQAPAPRNLRGVR